MDTTKKNTNPGNLTSKEGLTQNHSKETNAKMEKQYFEKYIDLEELKQLLLEGNTISYIADHFGVARATIRYKIKKYNLHAAREIGEEIQQNRLKLPEQDEKFCKHYMQFMGIKTIAQNYHVGPPKVKKALNDCHIHILESGKKTKVLEHVTDVNYYVPISSYLLEVIIGELLGDGCIGIQIQGEKSFPKGLDSETYFEQVSFLKTLLHSTFEAISLSLVPKFNDAVEYISQYPTAQFRIHVNLLENPWMSYLSSLFEKEGYKANIFIREKKIPTTNSNKTTGFDTSSSVQLFDIFAIWYPNNKKVLPNNLTITPNVLLHWYLGDGTFSKTSLCLATQSFTEAEVERLVQLLKRDANIDSYVSKHRDGFILLVRMNKDNVNRFFNYLEKANGTALNIAKTVFPWKFDKNLLFRDVLNSLKD